MTLRPYQQRAIDSLNKWFEDNPKGNPCLVLPTGAGKSHIIAALCKQYVKSWPDTRLLMLTHVKELIEQNAQKMMQHWPNAPMGIYSASIGKYEMGEAITFAGIQSVRQRGLLMGKIDLVIIDECHLVSHKQQGSYRHLIETLKINNPHLRVIGLTATPFRLGHGSIVSGDALFDDLIEPVGVWELIHDGYLSPLHSKITREKLSTEGVNKRGGEYIESELQKAVDTEQGNETIVREIIELAKDRQSWLIFCTGIDHAGHICQEMKAQGIDCALITGQTPKAEREEIISKFKSGKIRALSNANVLTTGFDAPNIDLIAMLRPTESAGLYMQMAGRGLRISEGKTDCLVLDFAGNISKHGPITHVQTPLNNEGSGEGNAPIKICDQCQEIVHISVRECPSCGFKFPEPVKKELKLDTSAEIIAERKAIAPVEMQVRRWDWAPHTSKATGNEMLKITYYSSSLTQKPVKEYLPVLNEGYAGEKSMNTLGQMAIKSGITDLSVDCDPKQEPSYWLQEIAFKMTNATPPKIITFEEEGRFQRMKQRIW